MTPSKTQRWFGPLALLLESVSIRQAEDEDEPDKRIAEGAASEAVGLLEATFDSIEEGILVVDDEGEIVNYNDRFLELWHIPEHLAEEGDASQLLDFVEQQLQDPEAFRAQVVALYERPEAVSEDQIQFKDGRVFHRTSRPQRVGEETTGRVWSFRDITNEVEIKRELEESNEQLENFASLLSHDLRGPLRGIASHLQQLDRKAGEDLPEDAREHLETAVSGATRCQSMIKGLHRLASLNQGASNRQDVALDAVLDEVVGQLSDTIEESGATIEVGSLPTVDADASQLIDLFQNLIENAIVYRGDGPPTVAIRSRPIVGGCVKVEVTDDGQGIPEEDRDSIFNLFTQGSNAGREGAGIGLALCKRVVERHSGEIEVESTPGEGSTFRFTLPLADADDAPG